MRRWEIEIEVDPVLKGVLWGLGIVVTALLLVIVLT